MSSQAEVEQAVASFVDAVNSGDFPAVTAAVSPDLVIVEDIAPFRWQGPNAAAEWLAAMGANAANLGVTSVQMRLTDEGRTEAEGERAYAVFSGELELGRADGEPLQAEGLLCFTLTRGGSGWLIDTLVWSGEAPE